MTDDPPFSPTLSFNSGELRNLLRMKRAYAKTAMNRINNLSAICSQCSQKRKVSHGKGGPEGFTCKTCLL